MRSLIAVLMIILPLGAWAQGRPKTIDDCEAIKEPLAYNACLASFGPTRRGDGPQVTEVPPDADKKRFVRRSGKRGKLVRARGKRAHAEFKVGKPTGKVVAQTKRKGKVTRIGATKTGAARKRVRRG